VLTWWVIALPSLVVLDGLARLAAAWAERIPTTVLALVEVDPARVDADVDEAVAPLPGGTAEWQATAEGHGWRASAG
jgi:hypothetical protein